MKLNKFLGFLMFSILSLSINAQADGLYDISSTDFQGTYFQGPYMLTDESVEQISNSVKWGLSDDGRLDPNEGLPEGHPLRNMSRRFLTTSIVLKSADLADNDGVKSYVVPDLTYKVKASNDGSSLGARVMPVGTTELTADVNSTLRKILYGEDTGESDQYIYTMTGHMGGYATGFHYLKELMSEKVKSDIGHVTAYYADYGYTRRGLDDTTLSTWSPKNMFLVSVKGVPQNATNLNAIIWSMLYYQNPDDYQFADDYSFDYVVNYNLEETLAFATGWLDHGWVRKDLVNRIYETYQANGRAKDRDILQKPYYDMLQYESEFGLYCYEGVTNTLNIALNVPLTEKWFKKIWGQEFGTQLFAQAEEKWEAVQHYYNEENGGHIEITTLRQHEDLLNQIKPLWVDDVPVQRGKPLFAQRDYDGSLINASDADPARDAKMKEVGVALSYKPETASEILRDFIVQYVPFHKAGGVNTALAILGFYEKVHKRTGVDEETYYGFAIPLVASLFQYEAGYISQKYNGNAQAIGAYQQATMTVLESKMGDSGVWPTLQASVTQALANPHLIAGAPSEELGRTYWNAYYQEVAKPQLEGKINFVPVAEPDIITQRILGKKYVKWNNRPGVLGAIALGIHATHPKVKFTSAVTVVSQDKVHRTRARDNYQVEQHQELVDFINAR